MDVRENIVQAAQFEVMRRVLEPVDDGMPDPGVDFDGCCEAVTNRIQKELQAMPTVCWDDYFRCKAQDALEWCEKQTLIPSVMRTQIRHWKNRQAN